MHVQVFVWLHTMFYCMCCVIKASESTQTLIIMLREWNDVLSNRLEGSFEWPISSGDWTVWTSQPSHLGGSNLALIIPLLGCAWTCAKTFYESTSRKIYRLALCLLPIAWRRKDFQLVIFILFICYKRKILNERSCGYPFRDYVLNLPTFQWKLSVVTSTW